MLPIEVMQKAQAEFLDYNDMGASVIEISHRSKEFGEIIDRSDALLRELANIPSNYKILYVHGGAQMQFSAVPLNLINRNPARKASFVLTGTWAVKASKEANRYGAFGGSAKRTTGAPLVRVGATLGVVEFGFRRVRVVLLCLAPKRARWRREGNTHGGLRDAERSHGRAAGGALAGDR